MQRRVAEQGRLVLPTIGVTDAVLVEGRIVVPGSDKGVVPAGWYVLAAVVVDVLAEDRRPIAGVVEPDGHRLRLVPVRPERMKAADPRVRVVPDAGVRVGL